MNYRTAFLRLLLVLPLVGSLGYSQRNWSIESEEQRDSSKMDVNQTAEEPPKYWLGMSGGPLTTLINTAVDDENIVGLREPDGEAFWIALHFTAEIEDVSLGIELIGARSKELVGVKGSASCSPWVWNNSGLGFGCIPFDRDAYFVLSSFGVRLSLQYKVISVSGISPWIGLIPGMFIWSARYTTEDESREWSSAKGVDFGYSLSTGLDLEFGSVLTSIFIEFGGPGIEPTFNDLFYDGWTYRPGTLAPLGHRRIGVGLALKI